ncbi:AAEL005111-PA [Aedes aegypti]|uniref:AAEL005111-PA n=1 Tax=Aedes aegypti TaxID=7159 RepID=Q17B18_AEDAE|nr:AAEL005111-PA [Aedes aegypti]
MSAGGCERVATSAFPNGSWQQNISCEAIFDGYVYFLLSFSLIGAVVLGLFGAYRCLRVAAIRVPPPEALALPIQFISDDLAAAAAAAASAATLNADPNHLPVPRPAGQADGWNKVVTNKYGAIEPLDGLQSQ